MASTDHHGTDDKLAKGAEQAAEGCHDCRIAETQTHVAAKSKVLVDIAKARQAQNGERKRRDVLCRGDLEKDGPHGEGLRRNAQS